jgi:cardiolipin synthase
MTLFVRGEVQVSAVIFRRRAARRLLVLLLALSASGCSYIFSEKRTVYRYEPTYPVESPEFLRSLDALGTEMVAGNRAALLQNGDAIFPSMLEAIAGAKTSINLEEYLFDHDETAIRFAEALAERARAGIAVRVLVDGFGQRLGPLEPRMTAAGVHVRIFKPLRLYSIDRVGDRTHRRILTVDGSIGFCGGVGIDDRWKGNARNEHEWRDTMIRVEGPVVEQLQHVFAQDWVHTTGEVLHGDRPVPRDTARRRRPRADRGRVARRFDLHVEAAPLHGDTGGALLDLDRERVLRAGEADPRGLIAAARRGVDVRIVVPGSTSTSPTCAWPRATTTASCSTRRGRSTSTGRR